MPESQIPEISARDLQDEKLFLLNRVLQFLAQQVASNIGVNGAVTFRDSISSPGISSTSTLSVSGQPTLSGLREFADNTAALAGGLFPGDVYKTATGELRIVV